MSKLSVKIRQACAKGVLAVPQGAGSALEALGVNTNLKGTGKAKHDESTSDHNHPTRAGGLNGLGGWWVGLAGVCSGVFAALVAAPVVPIRTRLILARKVLNMLTVFMLLSMILSLQPSRRAVHVVEHESLQSHVPSAFSPASHLDDPQRQRARDSGPHCSFTPFSIRKFTPERWAADTVDLERALVKGLRHGAFRFQGCLALGGWILLRVAADRLRVTVARIRDAINLDRSNPKPRLQYDPAKERVRAIQGHSADSGLTAEQLLAKEAFNAESLAAMVARLATMAPRLRL